MIYEIREEKNCAFIESITETVIDTAESVDSIDEVFFKDPMNLLLENGAVNNFDSIQKVL